MIPRDILCFRCVNYKPFTLERYSDVLGFGAIAECPCSHHALIRDECPEFKEREE